MDAEYYRLPKAAEMLGCSTDDLVNFGVNGKISFVVLLSGKYGFLLDKHCNGISGTTPKPITDNYGFVPVHRLKIYEAERSTGNACDLSIVSKNDDSGNYWMLIHTDYIPLNDNSILVLAIDVKEQQAEAVGGGGTGIDGKVLSKLEKQQAAILKAIKDKKFNPMAIPDNEKGTIKLICESDNQELFKAETAFDRAWKRGIGTLWQMENHNSYAHRGNN